MMRPIPFVRAPAAWAQVSRPSASVYSARQCPAVGVRCTSSSSTIQSGHIKVGENEGIIYVNSTLYIIDFVSSTDPQ